MAGPGDALFLALAQAKARPSKALRATEAAGQAGQDILGGYLQGKQINQQLEQYKLLSTPLGQMYSDPSQIPFGLSPTHTVKDLITLAPAMENYVPSSLISGAARSYGANVNDGSAPPPAPMGGTSNPAPPPGAMNLASIQGTGAGAQDNVPPGTPPAVIGNSQPSINIPPGGMGMKGFQNVVLPSLKAGQEERHFNETQSNEDRRQQNSIAAENARFGYGKNQESNQFQQTKQQQLRDKKEQIEKEFQDKNDAITSGQDAIQSSLLLKVKQAQSGEAGPVSGRVNTVLGNVSGGALSDSTYQLNKNNELQRTKLQHAQDVNRFNPQEVGYIGGGALAQPNEPMGVSVQKAQQAINTFQSQMQRNRTEKNAKLSALGLPPDNSPIPKIYVGQWLAQTGNSSSNQNIQTTPAIHQTAIQWAQSHPNDPRAKAVLAKAMASSGGQ